MLPPAVQRQIELAEAVAAGHREAASLCRKDQEALRARLEQGAHTIDVLVSLLQVATFSAELNRQPILEMRQ